jgi:dCTP deaminase
LILTGPAIASAVKSQQIHIAPFDSELLNPNSYNYRLGRELLVLNDDVLDAGRQPATNRFEIPDDGFVLQPKTIYLGHTHEIIGSDVYVPSLIGRSSMGRLGLFLQITADLGHIGTDHRWTLELTVVQPLRVYAGMRIGQVSFWKADHSNSPDPGQNYTDVPNNYARYSTSAPSQVSKFFE